MDLLHLIHQKTYEKIIKVVRRHYITFVPIVLLFIILDLAPIAVYFLISSMFPELLTGPIAFPLLVLFGSFYYLSVCLFFYGYFVDFYLDLLILTNDRLVDIDQRGLFARTIAEVELYQIQDVTSEVNGFWASLFNYGNIIIQTAGAIPKATLNNMPNPHQLRQELLDLSAEDKKYHQAN